MVRFYKSRTILKLKDYFFKIWDGLKQYYKFYRINWEVNFCL